MHTWKLPHHPSYGQYHGSRVATSAGRLKLIRDLIQDPVLVLLLYYYYYGQLGMRRFLFGFLGDKHGGAVDDTVIRRQVGARTYTRHQSRSSCAYLSQRKPAFCLVDPAAVYPRQRNEESCYIYVRCGCAGPRARFMPRGIHALQPSGLGRTRRRCSGGARPVRSGQSKGVAVSSDQKIRFVWFGNNASTHVSRKENLAWIKY